MFPLSQTGSMHSFVLTLSPDVGSPLDNKECLVKKSKIDIHETDGLLLGHRDNYEIYI